MTAEQQAEHEALVLHTARGIAAVLTTALVGRKSFDTALKLIPEDINDDWLAKTQQLLDDAWEQIRALKGSERELTDIFAKHPRSQLRRVK
jgi:hypothetical protein